MRKPITVETSVNDRVTVENFKILVVKVVAVTYERWSFTRGSKYDITGKLKLFWKNWWLRRHGRFYKRF